jgi:hypothetical protein
MGDYGALQRCRHVNNQQGHAVGWRRVWLPAWMARQQAQLAKSPLWMHGTTWQLAGPLGRTASRRATGEPFLEAVGMRRHWQTNMGGLVAFAVSWCLASSALAQLPQDHLNSQQSRERQFDHSRRQLEQQQQLNQERFRAEQGWQLHPRPQAPWEERRREDELRKEFQRGRQPPSP